MAQYHGILVKGIGGFYYVEAADAVYECKARGSFRKEGLSPLVGDRVSITVNEQGENTLDEISPRKNAFIRPPLANLDQLVLVSASCKPRPNTLLLDKMIALAEHRQVEPLLVFTKSDLESVEEWVRVYRHAGFSAFGVSAQSGEGVAEVKQALSGKISAFTGNSGVGKSTLLNAMDPELALNTGAISQKLGRGRHTTRHVELFHMAGGFVADTPGFSSLDFAWDESLGKEELAGCFREFRPYLGSCQFTSCLHVRDEGCAVTAAVDRGEIEPSRHESYKAMYEQIKDDAPWKKR